MYTMSDRFTHEVKRLTIGFPLLIDISIFRFWFGFDHDLAHYI